MPSGFKSGGVDFDDLFDPYIEGTKPVFTGYTSAGQDLRDRYAPISYGTKRADVGFASSGQDVSNLWAAKGTAVYLRYLRNESFSSVGGNLSASINIKIKSNGTIELNGEMQGFINLPAGSVGHQFRIRGVTTPVTNAVGTMAMITAKGGVNIVAQYANTDSVDFDTGYFAADDANKFWESVCQSSNNAGLAQMQGMAYIDVKRISDGLLIRTYAIDFLCTADSQA